MARLERELSAGSAPAAQLPRASASHTVNTAAPRSLSSLHATPRPRPHACLPTPSLCSSWAMPCSPRWARQRHVALARFGETLGAKEPGDDKCDPWPGILHSGAVGASRASDHLLAMLETRPPQGLSPGLAGPSPHHRPPPTAHLPSAHLPTAHRPPCPQRLSVLFTPVLIQTFCPLCWALCRTDQTGQL